MYHSLYDYLSKAAIYLMLTLACSFVYAGKADVIKGKITPLQGNSYRIDVTVKHADAGWDHYANEWQVLDEDGRVLGTRILHHPHVNEQPFTRSLTISIPQNVKSVRIRAQDSVHGYGGKSISLQVP
ncbi:hypothetical protein CBF23_001925 [Marinomonas agarivorans]|nr:hypothetical protein CBF23_001925 [Marinomonas agarivorans]